MRPAIIPEIQLEMPPGLPQAADNLTLDSVIRHHVQYVLDLNRGNKLAQPASFRSPAPRFTASSATNPSSPAEASAGELLNCTVQEVVLCFPRLFQLESGSPQKTQVSNPDESST
jgi:hypothetical protein